MSRPGDADAALAAVLEMAFHVACLAPQAEPPFEPPAALRSILHFTSLPTTALRKIRRVLDTDDEFRARVAAVVEADPATATLIGEAGMLFVQRPDGWQARFDALTATGAAAGAPDDRALARRLEGAEKAAARANDDLARANERIVSLTRTAADDRRRRSEVEAELAVVVGARTALEQERERLAAELTGARERVAALEAEADALAVALDAAQAELARRGAVEAAVGAARTAVDELRAALDGITAAATVASRSGGHGASARTPTPSRVERVRAAAAAGSQRRPVPLPPGVFGDEPAAAHHLLRVPGMLVVVDGYNVARTRWSDERPGPLREQLLALLSGAAARAKASVHVVFDGIGGRTLTTSPRTGLRVTFTDEGVDADDVILAVVAALPPEQKVLVVSSDRRVADGARALGANVVSSEQLLDAWA